MLSAGSLIWRRKRLSVADFENSCEANDAQLNGNSCKHFVTSFQREWEIEFLEHSFQPSMIRATCLMGSFWFLYDFCSSCLSCSPPADGAGGDSSWVLLTYILEPIMGTLLFLIAVISSIHRLRRTLSLRYNSMCVCVILSAYITLLFPAYILEIRRSLFQNPADPRIQWNISYLQGFPTRICNDSDPDRKSVV